jgi:hypothetical protein
MTLEVVVKFYKEQCAVVCIMGDHVVRFSLTEQL